MWSNVGGLVSSILLHTLSNSPNEFNSVGVIFYHGPSFNDNVTYGLNNITAILDNTHFDPSKNTTLYIHGFMENQDFVSIHVIVDAYNSRGTDNLLVLDWAKLVDDDYVRKAIPNYKQFGPVLADRLIELFNAGLNLETFNLVGHSLGGQLAGYVGREIDRKTSGRIKLPSITALDPAFPGFVFLGILPSISSRDGNFVQVIHTDAWSYGSPLEGAHVNVWPNGGTAIQPGCPPRDYVLLSDDDLCSHIRSWTYFAEAVAGKSEPFYAIKARSWVKFKMGMPSIPESVIVIGSHTPTDARGDYYFTTNSGTPYSRGIAGIKAS